MQISARSRARKLRLGVDRKNEIFTSVRETRGKIAETIRGYWKFARREKSKSAPDISIKPPAAGLRDIAARKSARLDRLWSRSVRYSKRTGSIVRRSPGALRRRAGRGGGGERRALKIICARRNNHISRLRRDGGTRGKLKNEVESAEPPGTAIEN